jgi:4-hydroxybenzoate polyprenyltransferase
MLKYLAWRNWAIVGYNSMTGNLFLFMYLALRHGIGGFGFITDFLIFYLLGAVATSYGYLVNDLGDRELDRVHGKKNVFHGDSNSRAIFVVCVFFIVSVLLSMFFWKYAGFLVLWLIWIFLSTGYSLPPLRLKEKGVWGLIAVVPAQRVIPALLVFSVFGGFTPVDGVILICYITVGGILSDVSHQIEDAPLDSSTGTSTFVNKFGVDKARALYNALLSADLILQLLVYVCAVVFLPKVMIYGIGVPVAVPLLVVYAAAAIGFVISQKNSTDGLSVAIKTEFGKFVHQVFPTFYFPLFLIVVHLSYHYSSIVLLALFGLLKNLFCLGTIKNSYTVLFINALLKKISHKS